VVSAILGPVVRVGLAIGISIVAAALVLPLALLIAWVLGRVLGSASASRLGSRLSGESLHGRVSERVEVAIIGGLIGGIVFTSLTPAIAPAMYDVHVESGLVDQPEPAVTVHQLQGVSTERVQAGFDVAPGDSYSLYVVELHNDDQRVLQDYNFNVRFPGCVETTSVGATNFGTAAVTNESEKVQLGEFTNRSTNTTCYGAIQVDEFPPGNSALVTFVVDETPESDQRQLYPEPADEGALTTNSYTWEYNGRSYHEDADPTPVAVEVHNVTDA
jgi:hypothetical protein